MASSSVIGFGGICRDISVVVSHFPTADEKVRTISSTFSIGGNVANCLCGLRRILSSSSSSFPLFLSLVSFVGATTASEELVREIEDFGIDVSLVSRVGPEEEEQEQDSGIAHQSSSSSSSIPVPFSYVVVVASPAGTRNVFHTPLWNSLRDFDVEELTRRVSALLVSSSQQQQKQQQHPLKKNNFFFFFDGMFPRVFGKVIPMLDREVPLVFNYEEALEMEELGEDGEATDDAFGVELAILERTNILVLNGRNPPVHILNRMKEKEKEEEEEAQHQKGQKRMLESSDDLLVIVSAYLEAFSSLRLVIVTLGKDGSILMSRGGNTPSSSSSLSNAFSSQKMMIGPPRMSFLGDLFHDQFSLLPPLTPRLYCYNSVVGRSCQTVQEFSVVHCSAARIETVVDSTGAGDAFSAGLLYGLMNHPEDFPLLLSFANFCGGRKCLTRGSVLPASVDFVGEWKRGLMEGGDT